jgi:hypothetical protein
VTDLDCFWVRLRSEWRRRQYQPIVIGPLSVPVGILEAYALKDPRLRRYDVELLRYLLWQPHGQIFI